MGRPVSQKCIDCSKLSFKEGFPKPICWSNSACPKKRSYYRKLEYYREAQRKNHHYIKYASDHCALCQSISELQVHHIKPQLNGGEHTKDNTMTLCPQCHSVITKYYQAIRGLKQLD